jgi:hypothetical protein
MAIFNKIPGFLKYIFLCRLARCLAIFLIIVIIIECISVWRVFELSKAHLVANDPRHLQNRSETVFYFAPFILYRNSFVKREEIIDYLDNIAYRKGDGTVPASYSLGNNSLSIKSRLSQLFPDAVLTFSRNQVTKITVNGLSVDRIELEPIPLQNVIDFVNDDTLKKDLRIRRVVLESGSIPQLVIDALLSNRG